MKLSTRSATNPCATAICCSNSDVIKDEFRGEFIKLLKKHANFFKHANRDEKEVEFHPVVSILFMMFAIRGIDAMKLPRNDAETAFILWQCINDPKFLTDEGRKIFIDAVGADQLNSFEAIGKDVFLQAFEAAQRSIRRMRGFCRLITASAGWVTSQLLKNQRSRIAAGRAGIANSELQSN